LTVPPKPNWYCSFSQEEIGMAPAGRIAPAVAAAINIAQIFFFIKCASLYLVGE
jgi:hypothetical protein